eukprot:COSAG01_NODE_411_length_17360_cov_11.401852_23_plen_57_part_00
MGSTGMGAGDILQFATETPSRQCSVRTACVRISKWVPATTQHRHRGQKEAQRTEGG